MKQIKIVEKEKALLLIEPHKEKLSEIIFSSFSDFLSIAKFSSENVMYAKFEPRTKFSLIHDYIKSNTFKVFENEANIKIGTWNQVFNLQIGTEIVIRFNSINKHYQPTGYKTPQRKEYYCQKELEGLPEKATRLLCGYTTDATFTKIQSLYIICYDYDGKTMLWKECLMNANSAQTLLELPKIEIEEPVIKRVMLKDNINLDIKQG